MNLTKGSRIHAPLCQMERRPGPIKPSKVLLCSPESGHSLNHPAKCNVEAISLLDIIKCDQGSCNHALYKENYSKSKPEGIKNTQWQPLKLHSDVHSKFNHLL